MVMSASCAVAAPIELYVAPDGDDANPGTLERPLATLQAARDTLRQTRAKGAEQQATVWLRGGRFILDETLVLTPEDSHTTYRAYQGETPVVSGGRVISGWKPVDGSVPNMSEAAKGKLWYAETPKDWRMHLLFIDDIAQQRSRHPNNDNYAAASDGRPDGNWPQISRWGHYSPKGMKITFADKGVLKGVPSNGDAELIYIVMQYASEISVLRDVNEAENSAYRCSRNPTYGKGRRGNKGHAIGSPARIENALIYLDEAGEWCVDTEAGRVYYWPHDGTMDGKSAMGARLYNLVVCQGYYEGSAWGGGKSRQPKPEQMPSDLVPLSYPDDLRDDYPTDATAFVNHVVFDGITFAHADRMPEDEFPEDWVLREFTNPDAALMLNGVEDCEVRNCSVLNVGACGITLRGHAQRVNITRNEIAYTGANGVYLCGYGPGTLDVNHHNTITLNYIHDIGYASYIHAGAVDMYQSGHNQVSENVFARTTYAAFQFAGIVAPDLNSKSRMSRQHTMDGKYGQIYNIRWNEMPKGLFNRWYNGRDRAKSSKLFPGEKRSRALSLRAAVDYCHIKNNVVAWNITVDPSWWGMEGGGFYSCYVLGDYNHWDNNLIWKSTGFPKSTVMALDGPHVAYFSQADNVVWINGPVSGNRPFFGTTEGHPAPKGQPPYLTFSNNVWVRTAAEGQPFVDKYDAIMKRINDKGGLLVEPDIHVPGIHEVRVEVEATETTFLDEIVVKVSALGRHDGLHYTFDGSTPTAQSPVVADGELTFSDTGQLRVVPFRAGAPAGAEVSRDFICIKSVENEIRINFQPAEIPVPKGFYADSGLAFGTRSDGLSYGWNNDNTKATRKRGKSEKIEEDTLVHFPADRIGTWEMAVPNGLYEVLVCVGDSAFPVRGQTLYAEGETLCRGLSLAAGDFWHEAKLVTVRDGRLSISAPRVGHSPSLARIAWLRVVPRYKELATQLSPVAPPSSPLTPGLRYGFFNALQPTVGRQWVNLLALETGEAAETGVVSEPSLDPLKQRTRCGLVFDGYLRIETPGLYTFTLNSDDGSRLSIGGNVIVDNDDIRDQPQTLSGDVQLDKGIYPAQIKYFQHDGTSVLDLKWEGPGFKKQHIPADAWFRP